jgi:hypothetical protein
MAYVQNNNPFKKQKLSAKAAKDKAARDLSYANTRDREIKRADSQKKHRKNPKMKNMDYDHKDNKFKTPKANRGNDGNGTKNE